MGGDLVDFVLHIVASAAIREWVYSLPFPPALLAVAAVVVLAGWRLIARRHSRPARRADR